MRKLYLNSFCYYHNVARNVGDYTIREFSYGVQDTTTVVCGIFGICIACKIIAVSNPGYKVYTIYGYLSSKFPGLFYVHILFDLLFFGDVAKSGEIKDVVNLGQPHLIRSSILSHP